MINIVKAIFVVDNFYLTSRASQKLFAIHVFDCLLMSTTAKLPVLSYDFYLLSLESIFLFIAVVLNFSVCLPSESFYCH